MNKIYQLKITLRDSNPPIWRRFLVPEDINLHKLHEVIQAVMGWEDDHLYAFAIKGKNYNGQPEFDYELEEENEETRGTNLNQLINKEKQTFRYDYDFGDNWEHDVILEKITGKEPDKFYPICIEGRNACPPENIGGIPGYYKALEELKKGELDEDTIDITFGDEDFKPEEFDVTQVNNDLQEYFGVSQIVLDKYTEPVKRLLYLDEPKEKGHKSTWPDYLSMGITEKDIPQLIEMLIDFELYETDSDNPTVWASLHAWRALGQLKSKEAIPHLINLFEKYENDDWLREEGPRVMGMIGEESIEPLKLYLFDKNKPETPRITAGHGLEKVGSLVSSKKEECINIFIDFLNQSDDKAPDLNGLVIGYLIDLNAQNAIEAIRSAFERNIVDLCCCGDLEDVEIELGLRQKRSTPARNYMKEKYSPFLPDIKLENLTLEQKKKVGRNEPCPCGSGKKDKKCCLK